MNRRGFLFGLTALPVAALAKPVRAAQAVTFYRLACRRGARLHDAQRLSHEAQLRAITGGRDVDAFIADRQRAMVSQLRELNDRIEAFLGRQ